MRHVKYYLSVDEQQPDEHALMTAKEVAKYLRITYATLWQWQRRQGLGLPRYRVGRTIRYKREEVIEWFASRVIK